MGAVPGLVILAALMKFVSPELDAYGVYFDLHEHIPHANSASFSVGVINTTLGSNLMLCAASHVQMQDIYLTLVFFNPRKHASLEALMKDLDAFYGSSKQHHVPVTPWWGVDPLLSFDKLKRAYNTSAANITQHSLLGWTEFSQSRWQTTGNLVTTFNALAHRMSAVSGLCFTFSRLTRDDSGEYIFLTLLRNNTVHVKVFDVTVTVPQPTVSLTVNVTGVGSVCLVDATCTVSGLYDEVSLVYTDGHGSQTAVLSRAHYFNTHHRIVQSEVSTRFACTRLSATFHSAISSLEMLEYAYTDFTFYCSASTGGLTAVAEVDIEASCAEALDMGEEHTPPAVTATPVTTATTLVPVIPPPPSPPVRPSAPVELIAALFLFIAISSLLAVYICLQTKSRAADCAHWCWSVVCACARRAWQYLRERAPAACRSLLHCVRLRHARLKDVDDDTRAFVGTDDICQA